MSLLLSFILGFIVTKKLSASIPKFSIIFFASSLGIILFTAINYFSSLIFSFSTGIIITQIIILIFEISYLLYFRINLNPLPYFYSIYKEKPLFNLIIIIGTILLILFNHHIIPSINGDLYTGESTYGDLPFHLSTIAGMAYGQKLPPDNPLYAGIPLVYPYLINFFSAILVFEGWSLRLSIVIPGLILSISLIGLIYDFTFSITKNSLKSFFTVLFYFFNGGLGFYFFLKDYSFNLTSIFQALFHPVSLKEYSHFFEQNIQWANFLSRMIVPERSLLFGIPAGIIILRLLFFKGTNKDFNALDLILPAFLISLMPLLHTHTVLAFIVILPIVGLLTLNKQHWKNQLSSYIFIAILATIFAIPHIFPFLNHVTESEGFFKFHLWWMVNNNESILWFWFKNTYLFILLSLTVLIFPQFATKETRILQVSALLLFVIINLAIFSPYNWDNVKFLFWAGLFFSLGAASLFGYLFQAKSFMIKAIALVIIITMISSALLSIWREINVGYLLFSKEAQIIGEQLRNTTPANAIFLTYKIHNSPISNLSGRPIVMGYPGLLWVHGINYQNREKDVDNIYNGSSDAKMLIDKYGIAYITVESYDPKGMIINRKFLEQFPTVLKTQTYTIYKVK